MAKKEYGDNVKCEIKANKLTIEIDLTKEYGPSKSNKNLTIGSTRGNTRLYDEKNKPVTIGINCFKPNPDYVPED